MSQQRFIRRGVTRIFWLKQVRAENKTPTRAELSAPNATELTEAISDVEGWSLSNEAIETPDMATTFTSSIPGEDKAESSSFTFYEDKVSNAIEQLLPKGQSAGWRSCGRGMCRGTRRWTSSRHDPGEASGPRTAAEAGRRRWRGL